MTAFFGAIAIFIIHSDVKGSSEGAQFIPASIFLLLAMLGNFMINMKPNWFIGIRTPWTLSNDDVWKKTHQVGGRVWFYGGMLCFVLSLFTKPEWTLGLILVFTLGSAAFFVGYSFWLYKSIENNNS